jgi:hypothetical protein
MERFMDIKTKVNLCKSKEKTVNLSATGIELHLPQKLLPEQHSY